MACPWAWLAQTWGHWEPGQFKIKKVIWTPEKWIKRTYKLKYIFKRAEFASSSTHIINFILQYNHLYAVDLTFKDTSYSNQKIHISTHSKENQLTNLSPHLKRSTRLCVTTTRFGFTPNPYSLIILVNNLIQYIRDATWHLLEIESIMLPTQFFPSNFICTLFYTIHTSGGRKPWPETDLNWLKATRNTIRRWTIQDLIRPEPKWPEAQDYLKGLKSILNPDDPKHETIRSRTTQNLTQHEPKQPKTQDGMKWNNQILTWIPKIKKIETTGSRSTKKLARLNKITQMEADQPQGSEIRKFTW